MKAKPNNKKITIAFIAIISSIVIVFLLLNILAYQHAHAMMYFSDHPAPKVKPENLSWGQKVNLLFTGVQLSRPTAGISPQVLSDQCKTITIANNHSPDLGAWYCPAGSQHPLVILFHGYAMDKSSLIEQARIFIKAQYAVLLVDFRGSWESSESYTTIGYLEAEDVVSAINYAQQHYQNEKIILYGQSMGAAAILRAIDKFEVKVDAIIVEGVFDSLLNTIKNRFHILGIPAFPSAQLLTFWGGLQAGFNAFEHNPVDYAKKVNSPILFFHGETDTRVKMTEAHKVYDSVSTKKYFSAFPETGHESHLARLPNKWKNEVMHFLEAEVFP